MESALNAGQRAQPIRDLPNQKEYAMEMFQLVAGIEAVKKVMRDQDSDAPLLPPIDSVYTSFRYKEDATSNGIERIGTAEPSTAGPENEKRVA
jgi:hypothetical protein